MHRQNKIGSRIILIAVMGFFTVAADGKPSVVSADLLLQKGRILFYAAVENESLLYDAESVFKQLSESAPAFMGRATTYTGALTALRGKHASWPQQKFDYVQKGLIQMEQGIAIQPKDIESLFIYGSTCYHLPFFFGRRDEAQKAFQRIIELLPERASDYDPAVLRNVVEFLEENAILDSTDRSVLRQTKNEIGNR